MVGVAEGEIEVVAEGRACGCGRGCGLNGGDDDDGCDGELFLVLRV